jgi:hypothetical protein
VSSASDIYGVGAIAALVLEESSDPVPEAVQVLLNEAGADDPGARPTPVELLHGFLAAL